jgi:hypothetical protein
LINPLSGLDRALHGGRGLKGWGSQAPTDPVLYYVNGFDSRRGTVNYEVNPTFGSVRRIGPLANEFGLAVDGSFDLSTPFREQLLDMAIHPPIRTTDPRAAAENIKRRYSHTIQNVYATILFQSDSLILSADQARALDSARVPYEAQVDSLWGGLATYLASLSHGYNAAAALARADSVSERVWQLGRQQSETVRMILSPLQLRLLPADMADWLFSATPKRQRRYF